MMLWVYSIQQYRLRDVLVTTKKKISHCLKQQLGLTMDEFKLIRCHGRFLNTDLTEDGMYPKLLP